MKRIKILLSVILYIGLLLAFVPKASAVTSPSFPSCLNPQGTLKVSYSEGTHGIPGDMATYTGSDSVYTLSGTTLTQCFCAVDGNGVQTNWWNVSALTDEEVQTLKSQGWIFIPDGSAWGLDSVPYLANNASYSCLGGTGGGSNSTSTGTSTGGVGGGDVLGASTGLTKGVLGLATTGNATYILGIISLGVLMIAFGSILSLKRNK